jgi:hypothetical protein
MTHPRSNVREFLTAAMIAAVVLFAGDPCQAQRIKSTLSGAVTDASGASSPGVEVALTNEGTNITTSFVTTDTGVFTFPFLDPGAYTLKASLSGFKTAVQKGIVVRVATDERVDLRLEIGAVAEQVEVIGRAPLLDNVSSTLGQVVDNKKIVDLPLNGRNIFTLQNTIPGSSLGGAAGSGVAATNPSINGTRPRGNNFTIDGVSANQEFSGTTGGAGVASIPQIDAIGEFKVITSNYSAEYGRTTGAVVTVGIKSGTNQLHGSLFEFLRNEVLDARNFFASPTASKPVLRYNQFGAAVGGPIRKDRLFFFSDVEFTRRRSTSVSTQTVPTLAMRNGDFSADSTLIYDPATTVVDGSRTTRTAFAGNIIPANRIDPIAKTLIGYWPAPNGPGLASNYLSTSSTGANVARHDTKIDYRPSASDSVSGRFSYYDNEVIGASTFPGPANPNLTAYQRIKAPGVQVNYTRTFSPKLLNEFRAGWQRNRTSLSGEKSSYDDWRTKLGLPKLFSDTSLQLGFPSIAPTGVGTIGQSTAAFLFYQNSHEYIDTMSWTRGKHFLKFGGSVARVRSQDYIPNSPAGTYNFSGQFTSLPGVSGTGRGFADFLLGWSSSASATLTVGGGVQPRSTEVGLFVQDDIRISRSLTLNIGMRYDVGTSIRTDEGTLWTYSPTSGTMVRAEPPAPADKNNVAPRFGFAWEFLPKSVLRGGYGIAYFPQFKGLAGFFGGPPSQQSRGFTATDATRPALMLRDGFGTFDETLSQAFVVTSANSVPRFAPDNLRSPYIQSWNLTLERQVGAAFVVSASYVGNKGTHLENIHQANQLPLALLGPNDRFGGLTPQQRRPFPNANLVQTMQNDLNGNYHSLQMKGEWRFARGLAFLTSYTWSKALEVFRGDNQDNWNRRGSYGPTRTDLRHAFVESWTYELPFGAGKSWLQGGGVVGQVLGGWQLNGILTARTGFPIRLSSTSNLSGSFNLYQRPDRLRDGALPENERTHDRWFDTTAFAVPQAFTFGTAGNNFLRGPGLFNVDLSLFKQFRIVEGKQLEFRAEAFNFTNTPSFQVPNAVIGTAQAGRITALSNDNRSIQFGLKFLF